MGRQTLQRFPLLLGNSCQHLHCVPSTVDCIFQLSSCSGSGSQVLQMVESGTWSTSRSWIYILRGLKLQSHDEIIALNSTKIESQPPKLLHAFSTIDPEVLFPRSLHPPRQSIVFFDCRVVQDRDLRYCKWLNLAHEAHQDRESITSAD